MFTRISLLLVGITILVVPVSATNASGCNLVPNGTFEQGSGVGWTLLGPNTPNASLTDSEYPGPVQSGNLAASVDVAVAGDVNLATVPEQTAIAVSPATSYTASARLLSSGGAMAAIRIVQWTASGAPLGSTFLPLGGGSGDWETLENSFTTTASTAYVSVRLVHHVSAGTFVWDDIALWQTTAGQRCVDWRHVVTQTTPGFKMCNQQSVPICIDGHKTDGLEFVVDYTNGIRDFYTHNGDGVSGDLSIGVHKTVESGNWRCFADPGEQCGNADGSNALFPSHRYPLMGFLPTMAGAALGGQVTPGAAQLNDWEPMDARALNPMDGSQPHLIGTLWKRRHAFVLDQLDLGGDIGVVQNVIVFETEGISVDPFGIATGGERLERYFFVQGLGRMRQEGFEDVDCRATVLLPSPDLLLCDGDFNNQTGANVFNTKQGIDFTYSLDEHYGLVDWW